jgi:hypothetical protein
MIEYMTKTGTLVLQDGNQEGQISFYRGAIYDSTYENYQGEAAVLTLLSWVKGTFTFFSQPLTTPQNIFSSLDELFKKLNDYYQAQEILNKLPSPSSYLIFSSKFDEALASTPFPKTIDLLLPLFDGKKTLGECLEKLSGNMEALELLTNLYHNQYLVLVKRK